ncbi:helix-turn-helix domain-containing protein [Micromonospora qiuiae]
MRASEIVAGPDAQRRERVRAVQAIAMCSDPVVFLMDVPAPVLRVDMLDGVRRLLNAGPPDTADPPDTTGRHLATNIADPHGTAGPHLTANIADPRGTGPPGTASPADTASPHDTASPADTAGPGDVATGEQVSADAPAPARVAIPPSARTGRRRPGRPPAMTSEQARAARRMHAAGTHSADEIAAEFGVSRATVYRYLDSAQNSETVLREF